MRWPEGGPVGEKKAEGGYIVSDADKIPKVKSASIGRSDASRSICPKNIQQVTSRGIIKRTKELGLYPDSAKP